jgi:hypothetical protein
MNHPWTYPTKVEYRLKYFMWNDSPHLCFFCDEEVTPDELQVHHKDGNHKNDNLRNLVPAHENCHAEFHYHNPGFSSRDRICPWCGTWFTPGKSTGIYCDPKHKAMAQRARKKFKDG